MTPIELVLYSKPNCPLCDEAKEVLHQVQKELPFRLIERNIEDDPAWWDAYHLMIPVVELDGEPIFYGKVSAHRLRRMLTAKAAGAPWLNPRYKEFLGRLRTWLKPGDESGIGDRHT